MPKDEHETTTDNTGQHVGQHSQVTTTEHIIIISIISQPRTKEYLIHIMIGFDYYISVIPKEKINFYHVCTYAKGIEIDPDDYVDKTVDSFVLNNNVNDETSSDGQKSVKIVL